MTEQITQEGFFNSILGDWVTHFESTKGVISLAPPSYASLGRYEIFCLKGDFFEGPKRYSTLEDAKLAIYQLLT